jgi:SAM-dependent methyltransferase
MQQTSISQQSDMGLVQPAVVARWNKSLAGGAVKKYPSLEVVRLERWYFKAGKGRLLEYGFGSGVNTMHLAECGYQIDGIDASSSAKKVVEDRLAQRPDIRGQVTLMLLPETATTLPYKSETFDFVLIVSVLSLLGAKEPVRGLLGELRRVLKPGGKIIADINSNKSQFAQEGLLIGDDIYANRGTARDEGEVRCYCPSKPEDFTALFEGLFEIDDVGFASYRYMNQAIDEFIVCARRPA